jgi:hypothetical protein
LLQLIVNADIDPSLPILATLMVETIHSSKTSVLARATWCNIPDGILRVYQFITVAFQSFDILVQDIYPAW